MAKKQTPTATAELNALLDQQLETAPAPSADLLVRIRASALEMLAAGKAAAELEEKAKQWRATERRYEQEVLPALMDEAGVASLAMTEGEQLVRDKEVYASISQDNLTTAVTWLIDHNAGAMVKERIVVEGEKGDVELLKATRKALRKARIGFEETGGVHASTLRAWVRERVEGGLEIPPSITYHVQPVVRVKKAKSTKGVR